jgi:hypothetical protein
MRMLTQRYTVRAVSKIAERPEDLHQ